MLYDAAHVVSKNLPQSSVKTPSTFNIKIMSMKVMIFITIILILAAIVAYVNAIALLHGGTILDSVFSILFIFSVVFFGVHSIGYYLNTIRSIEKYPNTVTRNTYIYSKSQVAVLVPMYNEPMDMLSMNLPAVVNASKGLAVVYVLDDSTNPESRKNIKNFCDNMGVQYIHRENRRGYKAGATNDILPVLKEEFVCILDADQMPDPSFLREVLPFLQNDPNLALVQVPQEYTNLDASLLSRAAQAQQIIFYDVITEGKSTLGTLFSCGTNIVYRKEALLSVGGFDENSITEDLATSVDMHMKGWKTFYYNKKLVYGRAPTELAAYFNQQWRWAFGTMQCFKKIFNKVLKNKSFSLAYKFDYFLSTSWYLSGWAYLIQMISPVAFLLFNIRPLNLDLTTYLLFLLPYSLFTLGTFLLTFIKSGNSLKSVFYNTSMNIISFPITTGASIQALRGKAKPFVTARTGSSVSWRSLWPQLLLITLLTTSIVKGILFDLQSWFTIVNIVGAGFHLAMLIPIFKINSAPKDSSLDSKILSLKN
ncbi:MAG: glycosyltransferase [Nitrosopumilus sp.]|nr:glycosyltransferase [Nitrosopumilus sp.]